MQVCFVVGSGVYHIPDVRYGVDGYYYASKCGVIEERGRGPFDAFIIVSVDKAISMGFRRPCMNCYGVDGEGVMYDDWIRDMPPDVNGVYLVVEDRRATGGYCFVTTKAFYYGYWDLGAFDGDIRCWQRMPELPLDYNYDKRCWNLEKDICPRCNGTQTIGDTICPECGGAGRL